MKWLAYVAEFLVSLLSERAQYGLEKAIFQFEVGGEFASFETWKERQETQRAQNNQEKRERAQGNVLP